MEMIHRPGEALSCMDVRETLSDLIDARRGEIPYPGGTRLAEPGMRSAVELHVASCTDCREELLTMEEVGAAFAEFSVDEAPVQRFAEYSRIIRERLARENVASPVAKAAVLRKVEPSRWNGMWRTVATSAIAASLAFVVATRMNQPQKLKDNKEKVVAQSTMPKVPIIVPLANNYSHNIPIRVQHQTPDAQFAMEDFDTNPVEPAGVKKIQDQVDQYKYVVLAERPATGEQPLLGAYIKTTRDVDHDGDGAELGGLVVYDVVPGSPAYQMGLRKDDHIIDINGTAVNDSGPMEAIKFLSGIRELGKGQSVRLQVVRPLGSQWLHMKPLTGQLGQYE